MSELALSPQTLPQSGANPLERLRGFAAQGAVRRALPWLVGAGALGAVALTWATLAPAPQRVLYSELGDAERAAVTSTLDTAGINYSIDNQTGVLSVGEDDLYRARMLVAQDGGVTAPSGDAALDSLPLGASRTMEGERLRSAREHELMLTIQEIEGVESVRVHLAEAARSVFVRDNAPPTASVMVRMARGRQLSESQVAAVVNLVAGSVPGMSADAVRVIDQHGRLVSAMGGGADNDRLELQSRTEAKLRAQLDQLLTPMLGAGMFTSEIQVELDLDEVTSARESYDKDGVVRSESQAQSQSAGSNALAGGVPGALSNTPPPASTVRAGPPQATVVPGAPAPNQASNGESSTTRTYELGREVSVANTAPGRIKRLSVAVAISQAVMKKSKPADLEAIKALVTAATGIDPQRGDQIQVMIRPFEPVSEEAAPFYEAPWFAMVVRSMVALIGVVLVLLLGVRPLARALKREPGEKTASTRPTAALPQTAADSALLSRQVGLAQRIVEEKPEDALDALRKMLGAPNPESAQ
jgi:flagellar M-ring protein FliF